MNYFTPGRYLALGNLHDEQAFLAAQQEWEEAIAGYRAHLARIRKQLPRGLRQLVASVYLHDARVLSVSRGDRFVVTLEPVSDPERLVTLSYSLIEEPQVREGVLPPDRRREPVEWLYDELDIDPPDGPANSPTFRHNILLSNGWEVQLRFQSAGAHRPVRVLPARPAAAGAH